MHIQVSTRVSTNMAYRISSVNANERAKLTYDITKGASIGIPKSKEDGEKAYKREEATRLNRQVTVLSCKSCFWACV